MIWKPVPSWPDYEVSADGQVRRCTMAPRLNAKAGQLKRARLSHGYLRLTLYRDRRAKTFQVHRLVALAFLGSPPTSDALVLHADGNRQNNAVSNLRWGDGFQNYADSVRHGTAARGTRQGHARLTLDQVREILKRLAAGERQSDIAAHFGVHKGTVCQIKRGKNWRWIAEAAVREVARA